MRLPAQRFLAPLIALGVLALGAAGCGRDEAPDLINGKTKFVQKCASCHTLQRANASGGAGAQPRPGVRPGTRRGHR